MGHWLLDGRAVRFGCQMDVLSELVGGLAGVQSGGHGSDVGLSGRTSPDW